MQFRSGGILISINIQKPDIYVFDNMGGKGKSYLCSLMKEAKRAGKTLWWIHIRRLPKRCRYSKIRRGFESSNGRPI